MSLWQQIVPAALVGTDRQLPWSLALPGEIGELVAQVGADTRDDPARHLLRAAAVLATCSLAGRQGDVPATARPAPAAPDPRPEMVDEALLPGLAQALLDGPARLQAEALGMLAQRGWRLPAVLLPRVLDLARRHTALRPAANRVLGERGRWLAQHQPGWRQVIEAGEVDEATASAEAARAAATSVSTAAAPADWAEARHPQRLVLLRAMRRQDPDATREWLATELNALPARERAELIATLADDLSASDEPALLRWLGDRSREVRQTVLGLLLRLPQGHHAQQAAARVQPLLRRERVLLRQHWVIDAPEQVDPSWEAAAIDTVRPKHDSLGERGWWLLQLVRQTPLAWWTDHTGMPPAELLAWAVGTDWSEALLRGWREVLTHTPDEAWCEAFLAGWPWKGLAGEASQIVALLPPARRERHWDQALRQGRLGLAGLLPELLAACPGDGTLGADLSRALAQAARKALSDPNVVYDHHLRNGLPELVCLLHPEALVQLQPLQPGGQETPGHLQLILTLAQIVTTRDALQRLQPSPWSTS